MSETAWQLLPLVLCLVGLHVMGSSPCKYTEKTVLMFYSFFCFWTSLCQREVLCVHSVPHTQTDTHTHTHTHTHTPLQGQNLSWHHFGSMPVLWLGDAATQQNDDGKGWLSSSLWRHISTLIVRLQRRKSGDVVPKCDTVCMRGRWGVDGLGQNEKKETFTQDRFPCPASI